jgi:hypothetical protein
MPQQGMIRCDDKEEEDAFAGSSLISESVACRLSRPECQSGPHQTRPRRSRQPSVRNEDFTAFLNSLFRYWRRIARRHLDASQINHTRNIIIGSIEYVLAANDWARGLFWLVPAVCAGHFGGLSSASIHPTDGHYQDHSYRRTTDYHRHRHCWMGRLALPETGI